VAEHTLEHRGGIRALNMYESGIPMQRRAAVVIAPAEAGFRLDAWLAARFTYHSRNQWQACIRDGAILVNGRTAKTAVTLHKGDTVDYLLPPHDEPPVDTDYRVAHEDAILILIDKPGNLPCHPAGPYFRHSLWHLLHQQLPEFWIINRLDRETSGLVLIARTRESAAELSCQFQEHTVRKEYLVLVEGEFPNAVEAAGYLVADAESLVRKKRRLVNRGEADSDYAETWMERVAAGGGLSLVRALPRTGKRHQIRATLWSLGYPVVGDKIYGCDDAHYLAFVNGSLTPSQRTALRMDRQALHAHGLTIRQCHGQGSLTVTAPLPADFEAILRQHAIKTQPAP